MRNVFSLVLACIMFAALLTSTHQQQPVDYYLGMYNKINQTLIATNAQLSRMKTAIGTSAPTYTQYLRLREMLLGEFLLTIQLTTTTRVRQGDGVLSADDKQKCCSVEMVLQMMLASSMELITGLLNQYEGKHLKVPEWIVDCRGKVPANPDQAAPAISTIEIFLKYQITYAGENQTIAYSNVTVQQIIKRIGTGKPTFIDALMVGSALNKLTATQAELSSTIPVRKAETVLATDQNQILQAQEEINTQQLGELIALINTILGKGSLQETSTDDRYIPIYKNQMIYLSYLMNRLDSVAVGVGVISSEQVIAVRNISLLLGVAKQEFNAVKDRRMADKYISAAQVATIAAFEGQNEMLIAAFSANITSMLSAVDPTTQSPQFDKIGLIYIREWIALNRTEMEVGKINQAFKNGKYAIHEIKQLKAIAQQNMNLYKEFNATMVERIAQKTLSDSEIKGLLAQESRNENQTVSLNTTIFTLLAQVPLAFAPPPPTPDFDRFWGTLHSMDLRLTDLKANVNKTNASAMTLQDKMAALAAIEAQALTIYARFNATLVQMAFNFVLTAEERSTLRKLGEQVAKLIKCVIVSKERLTNSNAYSPQYDTQLKNLTDIQVEVSLLSVKIGKAKPSDAQAIALRGYAQKVASIYSAFNITKNARRADRSLSQPTVMLLFVQELKEEKTIGRMGSTLVSLLNSHDNTQLTMVQFWQASLSSPMSQVKTNLKKGEWMLRAIGVALALLALL